MISDRVNRFPITINIRDEWMSFRRNQYWGLYNEDQRAGIIRKLMTEMEQNADASNRDSARQSWTQESQPTGGNAPGGNAYGGNTSGGSTSQVKSGFSTAFKNPAILLGTVALCILLVVAGIYISGKRRNAVSETGAPVSSEIAQAAETQGGAASNIAESDTEPAIAESGEENSESKRIELYSDQKVLITRDEKIDFPYTDEDGSVWFDFRIDNLSDRDTDFEVAEFLVRGILFNSTYAIAYNVGPGESMDVKLRITQLELKAAGIRDVKDASFCVHAKSASEMTRRITFETEGYDASSKPAGRPEDLIYSDDHIDFYLQGTEVTKVPGLLDPQFCFFLLAENKGDEEMHLSNQDGNWVKLNGKDTTCPVFGKIAASRTALIPYCFPAEDYLYEGEEFKTLVIPMELTDFSSYREFLEITIENSSDGHRTVSWKTGEKSSSDIAESGDPAQDPAVSDTDSALDYVMSHTEAASDTKAASDTEAAPDNGDKETKAAETQKQEANEEGSSKKQTATQPYTYKNMVIDLPLDAVPMPQGDIVYAFLYTKDNMDAIMFKYEPTNPLDLSIIRATTKEEMAEIMAAQNIPGYDGLLSFSKEEINGYPAVRVSFHMGTDKPMLVTEKEIYLENGYYKIQTHDKSGENTDVLKAALDSINLTQ